MGDLNSDNNSDNNEFKSNYKLWELNISPLDILRIFFSVIDAIPAEWRESLTTSAHIINEPFNLHNKIKLS